MAHQVPWSPTNPAAVEGVPAFTAHNVALPDGRQTLPTVPVLAGEPRMATIMRTLRLLEPEPSGKSVVDLGCLEGGYTVEFARAGYDAVGVEARAANIECCRFLADALDLPTLRFIHDDARNIIRHGPFDVAYCAGLLYHLDNPVAFLTSLAEVTRAVILQTHYAQDRKPPGYRKALGGLTTHEGRRGRWYREGADLAAVEGDRWAAYGNHRAFWLERGGLIRTLHDVGFTLVLEQHDTDDYTQRQHRGLFVAVR